MGPRGRVTLHSIGCSPSPTQTKLCWIVSTVLSAPTTNGDCSSLASTYPIWHIHRVPRPLSLHRNPFPPSPCHPGCKDTPHSISTALVWLAVGLLLVFFFFFSSLTLVIISMAEATSLCTCEVARGQILRSVKSESSMQAWFAVWCIVITGSGKEKKVVWIL